ncbi:MAG TPA: cysteine desulfurase-like protein [Actinomycetota bacterium]|jgi:cysteine desulfurase family protein (TIGR01976 family)|nr:cysteine desulfurase-like protein [Actinomycetota bacterium]
MALDVHEIRSRFPGLARMGEDGKPIVFADAPGGSQVPESVIEAMARYLRTSNTNAHGAFVTSHETDALIEEARRAGADVTGADPDEIVFGPNATSLLFSLSRAFARTLKPGDEVVVTRLDHDANVRPWMLAAEDAGATVRWFDVREDDVTLDLDSLDSVLSDRTRLVAFTLASNAVGTIPPAAEIIRRAHAAGALVAVDAVHLAQHRSLDARAIEADILACSPYKFFGPHLGMLAVRRELLEQWTPYKLRAAPDTVPARWETGTQNHEGLAGLVAAVEYLADVGRSAGGEPAERTRRAVVVAAFEAIGEHERSLSLRFLDGLGSVPGARLWGIADPERTHERTPTFAIRLGDLPPEKVAAELGSRGIHVWDGHYYAITIMERLGLLESGGAVRVGFCHYHSAGEVDRVVETLAAVGSIARPS